MKKNVLAVQSFGRENEYRRVVLTILSFYAYADDKETPTLLFTDNPIWFTTLLQGLPIHYIHLNSEKIKVMRGNIDFLHRMKIALIEEAFQLYPQHKIVYADSDTFFTANPDGILAQIAPDCSAMHLWEYEFESLKDRVLPAGKTFKAFYQLIQKQDFVIADGTTIKISPGMSSWNAGIMFFHPEHKRLIPDVYALTDQFFPTTQNHASEQYAFSIILQNNTDLQPCAEVIYHYWYNVKKSIVDDFLPNQLSKLLKLETSAERMNFAKELTRMLPNYFESHLLTHKDYAIQKFNEHEYWSGLKWAYSAILKGAFKDIVFLKDILYHTRKKIFG